MHNWIAPLALLLLPVSPLRGRGWVKAFRAASIRAESRVHQGGSRSCLFVLVLSAGYEPKKAEPADHQGSSLENLKRKVSGLSRATFAKVVNSPVWPVVSNHSSGAKCISPHISVHKPGGNRSVI